MARNAWLDSPSRREGRRPAQDELERFVQFLRLRLTSQEAVALLLAVADRKGVAWSQPRPWAVWEAVTTFTEKHVGYEEMVDFAREIRRRAAAGERAVRPELARALEPAATPRAAQKRAKPLPPVPRNADEWLESRRQKQSQAWKRNHESNRQTPRYDELRNARLEIAGQQCEREGCSSGPPLELHHLHYDTIGRETVGDVRMLCIACHEIETKRQRALRRARWRTRSRVEKLF